MIEVEIKNYESISYIKLQIEGFTTLVGRNYIGKSATLRAINAALTNKQGTDFIRWGEQFCEVRIKTPDVDIIWHKEEGNNFYKVNNREYPKSGKSEPPKDIYDAGFKPIVIADQKINLNYSVQFFPLFLVDKLDSRGADLLTSVYGLDRIYKAIDLCNRDQKKVSDLLKVREKDLILVNNSLERFKKFPNVLSHITEIKRDKAEIFKKETDVVIIKKWEKDLLSLAYKIKRLRDVSKINIPESKSITHEIKKYVYLVDNNKKINILEKEIESLDRVKNVKIPNNDSIKLKKSILEYQKIVRWFKSYKSLEKDIKNLEKINDIEIPKPLSGAEDLAFIKNKIIQLKDLALILKSDANKLNEIKEEIKAIKIKIAEFDICPLCGHTLKDK
jgi:hypothetical protein